jgi:hypothetical protein
MAKWQKCWLFKWIICSVCRADHTGSAAIHQHLQNACSFVSWLCEGTSHLQPPARISSKLLSPIPYNLSPVPYTPSRQRITPFGNLPVTNPRLWQQPGDSTRFLAISRQPTPDSGNNAATTGNKNSRPYQKQTNNRSVRREDDHVLFRL